MRRATVRSSLRTSCEGVEHGSTLTRNEIFGPVAPIVTFEDPADGIRMANDTEYGLISYRVRQRCRRGHQGGAADGIRNGRHQTAVSPPIRPPSFGGMKESGLGREGGFDGIHEFLETQYFAVDL